MAAASIPSPPEAEADSTAPVVDDFIAQFERTLADAALVKLVLAKPIAAAGDAVRVTVRSIELKGARVLSFVTTHATRDVTKNLAPAAAVAEVRALIATRFRHAHLFTATAEWQLLASRKGRRALRRVAQAPSAAAAAPVAPAHDRPKHRYVDIERPWLVELGVTDAQHRLVPAMARKWKQINKFVEVVDHALDAAGLKTAPQLSVLDFGSGKGYLTFALHDHLRNALGLAARVTGVELRADMVALGNAAVRRLGLEGLRFDEGDVRSVAPPAVDVMIALHACDTATDHAIASGVRAGARVIVCSPCCHQELRPQLLAPHPLRPLLKHGVHLGQQAEMLTDALRAMLLEASGYDTQVFEFVALEHTRKNKMILAVKRATAAPSAVAEAWSQVEALKRFYGVRDQCLETLLKARRGTAEAPA